MGVGKSFCACWLAYEFSKLIDKEFKVKESCAYTLEQSVEFINKNQKATLILDEMIELAFRREWYNKSHTHFIKMINTQRIKQIIYLLIIPDIKELDISIASKCDFLVYVRTRGIYLFGKLRKKHWSFDRHQNKAVWFEKIGVSMKRVPKKIWEDYEKYSKEMKIKINERIDKEIKAKRMKNEIGNFPDRIIEEIDKKML
jgi:hypothetical protein